MQVFSEIICRHRYVSLTSSHTARVIKLQTVGQNHPPACFCTALQDKNDFYILNRWKKQRIKIFLWYVKMIWNSHVSVHHKVWLEHGQAHSCTYCRRLLLLYNDRIVLRDDMAYQAKNIASGPFQKKFRNPWHSVTDPLTWMHKLYLHSFFKSS